MRPVFFFKARDLTFKDPNRVVGDSGTVLIIPEGSDQQPKNLALLPTLEGSTTSQHHPSRTKLPTHDSLGNGGDNANPEEGEKPGGRLFS